MAALAKGRHFFHHLPPGGCRHADRQAHEPPRSRARRLRTPLHPSRGLDLRCGAVRPHRPCHRRRRARLPRLLDRRLAQSRRPALSREIRRRRRTLTPPVRPQSGRRSPARRRSPGERAPRPQAGRRHGLEARDGLRPCALHRHDGRRRHAWRLEKAHPRHWCSHP